MLFRSACGCRILATAHGEDRQDVERRFGAQAVIWERMFDLFLLLGKKNGKCVVKVAQERGEETC